MIEMNLEGKLINYRVPFLENIATVLIITVPLCAMPVAIWQLWNGMVGWGEIVLLACAYLPISLGVTVGLHRYFTHESFKATLPLRIVLALCASLAIQGPIMQWVANHRFHHEFSDTQYDLHSPYKFGPITGVRSFMRGFWHSHIGWFFSGRKANAAHYVPKLFKDKVIRFFDRTFLLWTVVSIVFPYVFGGFQYILWVALVRICIIHHVTWSINSICHMVGSKSGETPKNDESRNVLVLTIPSLGESNHRNHHMAQRSALHADKWWKDISFMAIWISAYCTLASAVIIAKDGNYQRQKLFDRVK